MSHRHKLILACGHKEDPLHALQASHKSAHAQYPCTVQFVKYLHEVWRDVCKEMSDGLQARLYDNMKDYLNAVILQAHYRSPGIVPTIDEYIALRRSCLFTAVCFIFLEYALEIELDEETLQNESMQQLKDGDVDHVAFTNSILPCHVELFTRDEFNLPAIIYRNGRGSGQSSVGEAGDGEGQACVGFEEEMRVARRMLEELQ
ncbi:hypothetical protein L7F22_066113 [Adiantum nelumboides]|nr:hypothetical protein [Adiantum nelumboides]